jgi:AcrR family transcriptional regulator
MYKRDMGKRPNPATKEKLLDAAEEVLLDAGPAKLSVEAVVRRADLSKGAFFHYFASKEIMLGALLERLAGSIGTRIEALAAADANKRGRRLRAHANLTLDMPQAERKRLKALVLALVLAGIESEAVTASARAANESALAQAVDDGVALGRALVVQCALDGYWLGDALGTLKLDGKQLTAFREALLGIIAPAPPKRRKTIIR